MDKDMGFSIAEGGEALLWTGNGEYLRVESWGEGSVRVRARRMRPVDEGHDWALLPSGQVVRDCAITIDSEAGVATLSTGGLTVRATAHHRMNTAANYMECVCELVFFSADGRELFRERPEGGSLYLKAREYRFGAMGGQGAVVSFVAPEDEHLYGMGEYQQGRIDLKGCSLELANRNSQASVPFVVSSQGYGFLWNNPAIGQVTFASNVTQWRADATDQIDYWVTAGASPRQIERRYADATGHAPVMPEWGLGFWQCKLRYWNQRQVLEIARRFKERDIPLDVLIIDFFHWPHMGDFRFEEEFWPDPKAMCEELHAMGIKVMVSVWPQVSMQSENYLEMKSHNLLVSARSGVDVGMMCEGPSQFFDATNPRARAYVWGKCLANYVSQGVDAFWLDEAEPEYGTYDFENFEYWLGPNEKVANMYPNEYNRGFYEGQLAMGREGQTVNLTRCVWAGGQRYGTLVWSGDVHSTFADLRQQVICGIQMGMAGIPWFTTDMGGFHDGDVDSEEFRELLVRWCEFSCFLPVMRNHGCRVRRHPDGSMLEAVTDASGRARAASGAANEPWSYGAEVEAMMTDYIRVREVMRPYTRRLFDEAHRDGQPIMRGLFYEFPDDGRAAAIADEYLFGPDLLIAPVMELGSRSRTVYLPSGDGVTWTELATGATYLGGTTVTVDAPLGCIPVFARDGHDHGLAEVLPR